LRPWSSPSIRRRHFCSPTLYHPLIHHDEDCYHRRPYWVSFCFCPCPNRQGATYSNFVIFVAQFFVVGGWRTRMVLRIPMDLRCRGVNNSDAQHNILQTRMKINYPIHVRGWEELFYQWSIRGGRLFRSASLSWDRGISIRRCAAVGCLWRRCTRKAKLSSKIMSPGLKLAMEGSREPQRAATYAPSESLREANYLFTCSSESRQNHRRRSCCVIPHEEWLTALAKDWFSNTMREEKVCTWCELRGLEFSIFLHVSGLAKCMIDPFDRSVFWQ